MFRTKLVVVVLVLFFPGSSYAQSAINTTACEFEPAQWCEGLYEGEVAAFVNVTSITRLSEEEQEQFMTDQIMNEDWGDPIGIVTAEGEKWLAVRVDNDHEEPIGEGKKEIDSSSVNIRQETCTIRHSCTGTAAGKPALFITDYLWQELKAKHGSKEAVETEMPNRIEKLVGTVVKNGTKYHVALIKIN
jgi:hypothetical protein